MCSSDLFPSHDRGANIINRWSESYKKLLISSRLDTTKKLVESLNRVEKKDKLFISTSAVGIYDNKVKNMMRELLKRSSFKMWRKRVQGRATKHKLKVSYKTTRFQ